MPAATAFTKPKSNLYKSFLHLNGDEVINALAGIQGGEIDEVLTRTGEDGGGEVGAEAGLGPVRAKGNRKRARRFEEEVRRKRTEHSAATTLLRRLEEEGAIGEIGREYGPEVYEQLDDHMVVRFSAEITLHPIHQMTSAFKSWTKTAPMLGMPQREITEQAKDFKAFERLATGGSGAAESLLVLARVPGAPAAYRLVLPVYARHLLVPLDEFGGRATFVAQVDRKLEDGEEMLAVRMLRDAPLMPLERDAILGGLPDLVDAIAELGVTVAEEDFVISKPSVILKPICIYK